MSARKTNTLVCDGPPVRDFPCTMDITGDDGETLAAVRKRARAEGWRYLPGHPARGLARDICPRHPRADA